MAKKTHCDWCGKKLSKGRRRFCKNACKDHYHNWHNPRGKFAHLKDNPDSHTVPVDEFDDPRDDMHPFSEDALQGPW